MNYREHAKHSAIIFGGKPENYEPIHQIIDGNKIASTSVYTRFYMHHYDVGGAILEKLFGKSIGEVPVKKILLQHLLEDYGQVPLFKDWIRNGGIMPMRYCTVNPTKKPGDAEYIQRRLKEMHCAVSIETIEKIEDLLSLRYFTDSKQILDRPESPMNCCVFGHATGIYFAEKFLPPVMDGVDTLDLLTRYYSIRFQKVPTLMDYVGDWIEKKDWMLGPVINDRHDPAKVKALMDKVLTENDFGIKEIEVIVPSDFPEFNTRSCRGEDYD
jgi:hypothetical protein